MPSNTPRLSLPYPLATDPANPPSDIQKLALALDGIVTSFVEQNTAPVGTKGMVWYQTSTQEFFFYNGTSWVQWGATGPTGPTGPQGPPATVSTNVPSGGATTGSVWFQEGAGPNTPPYNAPEVFVNVGGSTWQPTAKAIYCVTSGAGTNFSLSTGNYVTETLPLNSVTNCDGVYFTNSNTISSGKIVLPVNGVWLLQATVQGGVSQNANILMQPCIYVYSGPGAYTSYEGTLTNITYASGGYSIASFIVPAPSGWTVETSCALTNSSSTNNSGEVVPLSLSALYLGSM